MSNRTTMPTRSTTDVTVIKGLLPLASRGYIRTPLSGRSGSTGGGEGQDDDGSSSRGGSCTPLQLPPLVVGSRDDHHEPGGFPPQAAQDLYLRRVQVLANHLTGASTLPAKIKWDRRVLMLGCGSIGQGFLLLCSLVLISYYSGSSDAHNDGRNAAFTGSCRVQQRYRGEADSGEMRL